MSGESDDDEDRRLILSRRELLIASALSGASLATAAASAQPPHVCLSRIPPHRTVRVVFSQAPGRIVTPLDRIPAPIRHHLRSHTIYAAGGGLTSAAWRVVLHLEDLLLEAGLDDRPGRASFGPLASAWSGHPAEASVWEIVDSANRAWREQRAPSSHPTADYDEVIAMRDGGVCYFAQGFGPLRGGAAEELVRRMRAAAEAARPVPR